MDDFVRRKDVIESFDDPAVERNYGDVDPDSVIRVIENIPTADVRPVVHGRWTGHDIGNGKPSIDEDTCSLCGSRFYQIAETGCEWNFCPNCGADMRGNNE